MKLMIIDDEMATRNGIMRYARLSQIGIDRVRSFKSAVEALQETIYYRPDIVISDIRMPDLDGITLCRQIRAILPECQLIFISGYADKETMKAALQLSAVSFVEKPLSIEELEEAIAKAIEKVRRENENYALRQSVRQNLRVIERDVLSQLLRGVYEDQFEDNARLIGLPLAEDTFFQVIRIYMEKPPEDRDSFRLKVLSCFERSERSVRHISETERCQLIIMDSDQMKTFSTENLQQELDSMLMMLKGDGVHVYASAGKVVRGYREASKSYHSTQELAERLFCSGYDHYQIWGSEFAKGGTKTDTAAVILEKLTVLLERRDLRLAEEEEKRLIHVIHAGAWAEEGLLKGAYQKLAELAFDRNERLHTGIDTGERELVRAKVRSAETVDELHRILEDCLAEGEEKVREREKVGSTVYRIMRMIRDEYQDPELSVTDLARRVYVTPTYLSGLFRKETGETIGQYLTKVRIEAAKKMMEDPEFKLYEVAEKSGFSNQNYFTKVFKKYTGRNPSDYRNRDL